MSRPANHTPTWKNWLLLAVGLWAFLVPSWALVPGNPTCGPKKRVWDFFSKTGISCLANPFVSLALASGKVACGYENRVDPNCCGEQWDADLGLYYNRARYLNTDSGRFWSQDKYLGNRDIPLSFAKYLFSLANPISFTDRSGYYVDPTDFLIDGLIVHRAIGRHFVGGDFLRLANYYSIGAGIASLALGPELKIAAAAVDGVGLKPDLIDIGSREVWEIKTERSYYLASADLELYLMILNEITPDRSWHAGTSYSPPSKVSGLLGRAVYPKVVAPGIILYNPFIGRDEAAGAAAGAAVLYMLSSSAARAGMASVINTVTEAVLINTLAPVG